MRRVIQDEEVRDEYFEAICSIRSIVNSNTNPTAKQLDEIIQYARKARELRRTPK